MRWAAQGTAVLLLQGHHASPGTRTRCTSHEAFESHGQVTLVLLRKRQRGSSEANADEQKAPDSAVGGRRPELSFLRTRNTIQAVWAQMRGGSSN